MPHQYFEKEFFPKKGVKEIAWPFRITAKENNDILIILAHGFTSSPAVMSDLADYLAEGGMDVEAVLLAGHGGDLELLEKSTHHDWIDGFEKILLANIVKYKKIFLLGHSLGANVAIYLAEKYPQIAGLILFGAPIYVKSEKMAKIFLPFYRCLRVKTWKKLWLKNDDLEYMSQTGSHADIPIKSIVEFYNFIDDHSKKSVEKLDIPLLLIHSRYDNVSYPISSQFIFTKAKSKDKEIYILGKQSHGIFHKSRRDFVFKKVAGFVRKYS